MKKIISFLTIISLLFLATGFSGCEEKRNPRSNLQIAQEMAQEIMDCFITKDEDALFSLLIQEAQEFFLTRIQIRDAFDLIDGEIISYDLPTDTGGGGRSVRDGKVVSQHMSPRIYNIMADSGKRYRITFQYFLVFEEDRNAEGLNSITISLMDEENAHIDGFLERIQIGGILS